jgi:hypothetical protein
LSLIIWINIYTKKKIINKINKTLFNYSLFLFFRLFNYNDDSFGIKDLFEEHLDAPYKETRDKFKNIVCYNFLTIIIN